MLQSSGDGWANPARPLVSGVRDVMSRLGIDVCFHVSKYGRGFLNAGGGEDLPPALRLLWIERLDLVFLVLVLVLSKDLVREHRKFVRRVAGCEGV